MAGRHRYWYIGPAGEPFIAGPGEGEADGAGAAVSWACERTGTNTVKSTSRASPGATSRIDRLAFTSMLSRYLTLLQQIVSLSYPPGVQRYGPCTNNEEKQ